MNTYAPLAIESPAGPDTVAREDAASIAEKAKAAIALKNVMGLVCDPVAGLVECPCIKRNAIGAVNAVLSCDMALAGITSLIPFDEVVEAMQGVSHLMSKELRETAKGGLAATDTGRRIAEELISGERQARR